MGIYERETVLGPHDISQMAMTCDQISKKDESSQMKQDQFL